MPQFTIDLSDKAVQKLQAVVDTYNANTGQNLTVRDWLVLHIKDVAIQQELSRAITQIQEQHRRDAEAALEAAVAAERDRLLMELSRGTGNR